MAFVVKFIKGVRNHWKKSTFAAVMLTYGVNYVKTRYETQELMRVYCEKAAEYGKRPIPVNEVPKTITIILNPNANKRKSTKNFEKYCTPILNLAGICVEIVHTESEGHARTLVEDLAPTNAIVVAGGDGTLSEVVTGILRKTGESNEGLLPIGILPLGKSNTLAKALFPGEERLGEVQSLADAALAIVEEVLKPVDVMKIQVLEESETEEAPKPVYAISGIEWGAYRDAQVKKEKYWYFGNLRKYATYVFNGYKNNLNWNCEATVKYSAPCNGCSNCHIMKKVESKRWYQRFLSNKSKTNDFSNIVNDTCKEIVETDISTYDLSLTTMNIRPGTKDQTPKLILEVGPRDIKYLDFVEQGWQSEQGEAKQVANTFEARQLEIRPVKGKTEQWFSIDKEDFEVKPIIVTLLPKFIQMYCKKNSEVNVM